MLIMIVFLTIVSILAVATVGANVVSIIQGEIAERKIKVYRENKDGSITPIERRTHR